MRIGIDVGGTFTDVILTDDRMERVWTAKTPTTPADPVEGAINGVRLILAQSGQNGADVTFVGHGTTIATNMIVERKGAECVLVTTKGFRDILEIRRAARHDRADLYDLFFENPPPLVPRRSRLEVAERILYNGAIETPLLADSIADLIEAIAVASPRAIAVSLINAYVNPAHEAAIVEALRGAFPEAFVSASHEVNPEILEYERTSTTVINAQLGPRCASYITGFSARLAETGVAADVLFMQSNGGLATPAATRSRPVTLLQSGPAGGVTAAAQLCERLALRNAIAGDMGGTTFDVSIIRDGKAEVRTSNLLASHIVRAPTIDIESIGAGGGSIAMVDPSGGLHVGPASAGADPGPACYGRGGQHATVTDCNLLLGYIAPGRALSGDFDLDATAAATAITREVGEPLGLDVIAAARAVRSIANANMAQAIRLMTVGRGLDPRTFSYICFGGGGPVHAIEIADILEIKSVIVPPLPGLFSAFGMIVADQRYDVQATVLKTVNRLSQGDLDSSIAHLGERLDRSLKAAGVSGENRHITLSADCRYIGQADALTIELPATPALADIVSCFERAHLRQWNFIDAGRSIQLVSLRLTAVSPSTRLQPGRAAPAGRTLHAHARRQIVFEEGVAEVPVYLRADLSPGTQISGPAVIDEDNSSFVLSHRWQATIDAEGNIVAVKEQADA